MGAAYLSSSCSLETSFSLPVTKRPWSPAQNVLQAWPHMPCSELALISFLYGLPCFLSLLSPARQTAGVDILPGLHPRMLLVMIYLLAQSQLSGLSYLWAGMQNFAKVPYHHAPPGSPGELYPRPSSRVPISQRGD